jgi:hypothetical protein
MIGDTVILAEVDGFTVGDAGWRRSVRGFQVVISIDYQVLTLSDFGQRIPIPDRKRMRKHNVTRCFAS